MAMDNENSEQAQERREKPLNDLLTPSMVHIYIGSENTHWFIHERLLCYYSPFFSEIFYADDKDPEKQKAQRNKAYGLPDEEDLAFEMLVGWLYSRNIKVPTEEKDVGPLLDLYLLSEKLRIEKLSNELVEAISDFYYNSKTYPSLRRVQHVYANTDDDNSMREMMVGAVAKLLTTSEKVPSHWASALQRNGQLAVDIIRSIQQWKLEENSIPDARDRSSSRGRSAKGGFSTIDRNGTESIETDKTGATSNLGVESLNSDGEGDHAMTDSKVLKSEDSEAPIIISLSPPPNYSSTVTSPSPPDLPSIPSPSTIWNTPSSKDELPLRPKKPPDQPFENTSASQKPLSISSTTSSISNSSPNAPKRRRLSVTFSDQVTYSTGSGGNSIYTFFPPGFAGIAPTFPQAVDETETEQKDMDGTNTGGNEGLGLTSLPDITQTTTQEHDEAKGDSQALVIHQQHQEQQREIETRLDSTLNNDEDIGETIEISSSDGIVTNYKHGNNTKPGPETVMLGFLWILCLSWLANSGMKF